MRSSRSLIQTIGRAARNVSGQVIMYADKMTDSMRQAIDETNRRREKQVAYNNERGIDPQPLRKKIADITDVLAREEADTQELMAEPVAGDRRSRTVALGAEGDLRALIEDLSEQMRAAAGELHFELAARLRDEIRDLKKELRSMLAATGGR